MLEIIVWLIIFNVLMGIVLVVQYWAELVRAQESYTRDELLDFLTIIPKRLKRLAKDEELGPGIASLLAGIGAGWFLTFLGGLFSQNLMPDVPDFAEGGVPNYFFQSALFVFVIHIAWPSFKDFALDRGGEQGMFYKMLSTELPFFVGLAVCIAAVNLTCWGIHHEMSFLFTLADMLILLGYAGYRIDSMEEAPAPRSRPGQSGGLRRRPVDDDEY